jgi:translation initiation factor RLI1
VLGKVIGKLVSATDARFIDAKSIKLLNSIVGTFIKEIAKKTGQPQKPTTTGFADYARNRIKIEVALKKIIENFAKVIRPVEEFAGSLGAKGEMCCKTIVVMQNGTFAGSAYAPVKKNIKKTPQKEFAKGVNTISKYIYSIDLFEKIAEWNDIESVETIKSLTDLLQFHKHFAVNGDIYHPSNGESSMILLFKELMEEKDIYLIDEPEKSLGNDYISEVIVPLLKEKALLGKKIIIATPCLTTRFTGCMITA